MWFPIVITPYFSDRPLGVGLLWKPPEGEREGGQSGSCRGESEGVGIISEGWAVGILYCFYHDGFTTNH